MAKRGPGSCYCSAITGGKFWGGRNGKAAGRHVRHVGVGSAQPGPVLEAQTIEHLFFFWVGPLGDVMTANIR